MQPSNDRDRECQEARYRERLSSEARLGLGLEIHRLAPGHCSAVREHGCVGRRALAEESRKNENVPDSVLSHGTLVEQPLPRKSAHD